MNISPVKLLDVLLAQLEDYFQLERHGNMLNVLYITDINQKVQELKVVS
ncbi:hypothetical protein G8J22_00118 [Lentilactobacillus hilgardii]|nr:hypothetical protein [Lentilactobacillus hilgardii]EEI20830.1 hypothetical protein HMPREF0497_0389 [Lentilactobacillus buchneri ATCC 11577]QIR08184.1 hypothetical protein G8J22_00118 [Lentilactobacillus hilgardii]